MDDCLQANAARIGKSGALTTCESMDKDQPARVDEKLEDSMNMNDS